MQMSSMLQDSIDGSLSSKRVVTISAFLLCAIAFIANLFFGMKIDQFIFDSMSYIAMAGLGATVAEKFTKSETIRTAQSPNYYPYQAPQNQAYQRRGNCLPIQQDPLI